MEEQVIKIIFPSKVLQFRKIEETNFRYLYLEALLVKTYYYYSTVFTINIYLY